MLLTRLFKFFTIFNNFCRGAKLCASKSTRKTDSIIMNVKPVVITREYHTF